MRISDARCEGSNLVLSLADFEAVQDARRLVYGFKPNNYNLVAEKKKRSQNANSYAWVLITKIADVVRADKEEVYKDMLRHYGQSDMVSVKSSINVDGYFKYYDVAGESELNGKAFTHYKIYKGSSEYDTREMSILIDGIVNEAKALDIETLTPCELKRLKEEWR